VEAVVHINWDLAFTVAVGVSIAAAAGWLVYCLLFLGTLIIDWVLR
jgi:hypothetical protein